MAKHTKFLVSLTLAFSLFAQIPLAFSREMSKAGQVFLNVKDGVVTVFSASGHGSGSLIDNSGLILTNNHVIRENKDHLRVKFGTNQVVEAKIIEKDTESDLAIIWINLDKISNYKVLEAFKPQNNEPLVLVGEEIIAIGSPISREMLDRTLTTGVVSRFDETTIRHDASINGGNSGGPLLNYESKIVGINTFVQSANGPSIAGAVPISRAIPLIESAKKKLEKETKPSADLLPDIPAIPYPIAHLLKNTPVAFTKQKQSDYHLGSYYFDISILTPPQGYYRQLKDEESILKKRANRGRRKGFEVSDDEKETKNLSYYDYKKPVVNFYVAPKPKLTNTSRVVNTLSFIAATGATVATMGSTLPLMATPFFMGKHEVKKDFLKMKLVNNANKEVCVPIETGRIPFTKTMARVTGTSYVDYIDKSYIGAYAFDSKCFETQQPLKLVIDIEGKDADKTILLPEKTRKLIVEDFKPYWAYVASLNQIPVSDAMSVLAVEESKNNVEGKNNKSQPAANKAEKLTTQSASTKK